MAVVGLSEKFALSHEEREQSRGAYSFFLALFLKDEVDPIWTLTVIGTGLPV